MTGPRPAPPARIGVALAVRVLPRDAQARYRAEFLAELDGLSAAAQLRHTAGLLAASPALRTALLVSPEEDVMPLLAPRGSFLRCRLFRWHDFARRWTPDGGRYQACRRCGVDRGPAGYGPMTTMPWPYWQ